MNKNMNSPSKLTEFAPLKTEEKTQTVGEIISRFFKLGNPFATEEQNTLPNDASSQDLPSWVDTTEVLSNEIPYNVDITEGRSLPNVLKRISNLLALKSNSLQNYGDTELKQYWMPDSVSKQCYECSEKFTTFRRRHHCRVCGQIFCSSCCSQQIPGKIFGCTGDLRVCTYCCKIVLSYLSSDNGSDLTTDLKALQENLRSKLSISSPLSPSKIDNPSQNMKFEAVDGSKNSLTGGYQEEMFASGVSSSSSVLSYEEKCRAYQNSLSLRSLFEEISKPIGGIALGSHRYHLRTYFDCFLGSELVDWLIYQQKASSRIQANAICQALLEGNYIECLSETNSFVDSYVLYKLGTLTSLDCPPPTNIYDIPIQEEPMWVQQIIQESNKVDSDNDQVTPGNEAFLKSSSSFMLDLNVEANTVYLSKPLCSPQDTQLLLSSETDYREFGEKPEVRTSEQREFVPESGWHNASSLREQNGEKAAYQILTNAYDQHEQSLMKQILATNGLSLTWSNILLPIIHDVVNVTRPDKNHDARDLDIRHYVQIKKLPGGFKRDTRIVEGVVFTKNVAHKGMLQDIQNPKILLLQGAIVYQRTEGRFMSLEPVLMQEHEYLRNVCARIIALQPDIVMVQRNVSRLAQDFLREKGITLVHNVKQSVLDRLSSCTLADLVGSLDAHIGRPRLGTCKRFYLKNYTISKDKTCKTLMFLEGLPMAHLGTTVLLRGASKHELLKIKKIFSFILFSTYNWRLEKSFLMDEFAQPPEFKCEFFDETKEITSFQTTQQNNEKFSDDLKTWKEEEFLKNNQNNALCMEERIQYSSQTSNEDRNLTVQMVNDFSDPLHSSYNDSSAVEQHQAFEVSELPFSNKFRKALDDTILCISPYVIFPIPYLETESGKKCLLRKFFPTEIYHSPQFDNNIKVKQKEIETNDLDIIERPDIGPPHPFTTAKFITSVDSNEIQNLLAHFRACGGRFKKRNSILKPLRKVEEVSVKEESDKIDVLDPLNHQRLAVLFCSFSNESLNAPAFCMNPGVVYMDFYGRNDIPLGCFLEKYCFREAYTCPSNTCGMSMVKHVRRFVHNLGCVSIFLNSFESGFSEENIVMWSWCLKCQSVSPVVPMSTDTWSFSFAKYLELKFHGSKYGRRGNAPCDHSLHHDHYQYFGYKNDVASFRYSTIDIWEISLPPPVIKLNVNLEVQHQILIEEIKELAQKGHDVFSAISEKIPVVTSIPETISSLKEALTKDKLLFRQKIEEVQLKLTSPIAEEKDFHPEEVSEIYWKLSDRVVLVKKYLIEIVDNWNVRLTLEADKKKENDKRRDRNTFSESDSANNDVNSSNSQKSEPELSHSLGTVGEQSKNLESNLNGENEDVSVLSLRQYQKSQSEISVASCDISENKRDTDKISVKTLLSQLLPSSAPSSMISNPFSAHEHYNLPSGVHATLTVSETDLSSIIAYALNSHELVKLVEDLRQPVSNMDSCSSPGNRRSQGEKDKSDAGEEKNGGLLGFLRNKDSKTDLLKGPASAVQSEGNAASQQSTAETAGDTKKLHLDVVFEDATCNFLCRIYYAENFAALRETVLPEGERLYIRSLSKSSPWDARGGKSGSAFTKTTDDRFILKEMSKNEVNLFLESAANYFTYMQKCYTTDQPTLLGKIVGIYQIIFKNNTNGHQMRKNLLVMENLFYNRDVSQKFDLKGSIRNRLVIPDNQEGEIVLLDENLLKMTCDSPLYILPHSKAVLAAAIENDTDFLASQSVMDYSLLVGLDMEKKELVLGIIDYIRTFTWDKKLETIFKKSGILGGQGKQPTIISPIEYQKRFIEAMHKYFLEVPDHWEGLGEDLC
ncbi:1-phosphatidylinositol 3-phosphate 5-kinase [Coccinella septempunctata]|uniref:1-phosphatidylinositol 3-phosphate 5-kinase n=1 Tax=Coccinella septempunctata TaxID=41139 RepID=UPI001D092379|nr:1-phosphatidylinositol 3-phosphate 5-kinase [Coccinella septempunctata]